MRRRSLAAGLVVASACTGFSLGENVPGGDTWTEPPPTADGEHRVGAIAVERDEDQLWVVHQENRAGVIRGRLAAIDPVAGTSVDVLDVSGTEDRRVVFPAADRMVLMAQAQGTEHLVLFDTTTHARLASTTVPTWYWGTRTAPSGRALVVADNADPQAPLHVIDTATLQHQVLVHGGDLVEAMWNHSSDVLLALSVTAPFTDHPTARLLRYDLAGVDLTAPLPAPTVVWALAGYGWDFLFSFSWIGVSPDDRYAVFPVIKRTVGSDDRAHVLLILDQQTGAVTLAPGAGPVGFTRDGRSIVSYGPGPDGGEDLWLIDPATRIRTVVPLPYAGGISFAPMRGSDHVVTVDAWGGSAPLTIYDVARARLTATTATGLALQDFVARPGRAQLFLESGGALYDVALDPGTVTPVSTPTISNINVRPSADQVVAAATATATIHRIAMATHALAAPIELPSPFAGPGPDALRAVAVAGAARLVEPRLTTRAAHDGDAISLDR